ncbi:MAG: 3-dehydroquinate synthase [Chlamydiia bacterium]|nr:3-dehydroquinate synthase [Chlamydiia bacterium]
MTQNIFDMCRQLGKNVAIITDTIVGHLHGEQLKEQFIDQGIETILIAFPPGEIYKTRETKHSIENEMLKNGCGKQTCIVALGGGVVTDMAGFVAATFMRGVPIIMVPTTLLAMVDAAFGGKNGLNTPFGKNQIGSIYPPNQVVINPQFLITLPKNEMINGSAEVIKYALIKDPYLFYMLEEKHQQWIEGDGAFIEEVVTRCIEIKKKVVEKDPMCQGYRHILNFGHTIAHALELLTDFQMKHGRAVGIGMALEAYFSMKLKLLQEKQFEKIIRLLQQYQFPLEIPSQIDDDQILAALKRDKKSLNQTPRFITLADIGKVSETDGQYLKVVGPSVLKDGLAWIRSELLLTV